MKYSKKIEFEVGRFIPDGLAMSAESIDRFRLELFTEAVAEALREALESGIKLPRRIRLVGELEVQD